MNLSISSLRSAYKNDSLSVKDVVERVLKRVNDADQKGVWISTVSADKALKVAAELDARRNDIDDLPLFGLPFSVKDNIDVAGEPTTAACPDFEYIAVESAMVVQAAIDAGAVFIGKTNLDQFATGLVGVRTPYDIPVNPYNAKYIPGGSSSGAAVGVATDVVSFAFGTDTGGSGRVPASYNGITGFKPSPELLSRRGLVFACRSIDTATIFAGSSSDAIEVFGAVSVVDEDDPFQDKVASSDIMVDVKLDKLNIGIPGQDQLQFFGDDETPLFFKEAVEQAHRFFGATKTIDFAQFTAINDLMFFGPLLSERDVSVGEFVDAYPEACVPVVQKLIQGSRRFTAADAYRAMYRVMEAKLAVESVWNEIDVLMIPTVGRVYTVEEVLKNPLELNFNNGYYTNYANPLSLSAVATPFTINNDGVPWGVTFLAKAGKEHLLAKVADAFSTKRNVLHGQFIC